MLFLDISYNHFYYTGIGPISLRISKNCCIQLLTNNGTGKTMILKTLMGILLPSMGYFEKNNIDLLKLRNKNYMLSNSQLKKINLMNAIKKNKEIWLFDEPYSFLDLTSINLIKKKINVHLNKKGTVIFTNCTSKKMLPFFYFYYGLKWL